jgi:hypothetical protein
MKARSSAVDRSYFDDLAEADEVPPPPADPRRGKLDGLIAAWRAAPPAERMTPTEVTVKAAPMIAAEEDRALANLGRQMAELLRRAAPVRRGGGR